MTVQEIYDNWLNEEIRSKWGLSLLSILTPLSKKEFSSFQINYEIKYCRDVIPTSDFFFQEQKKVLKSCLETEVAPIGTQIRKCLKLPPLTWNTEVNLI